MIFQWSPSSLGYMMMQRSDRGAVWCDNVM